MGCRECGEEFENIRVHDNCICETVRAIKRIQGIQREENCDDCRTDCFLAPLGSLANPSRRRINTRVFTLTTDDGDLFKAMFKRRRHERDRDRDRERSHEHGREKEREKERNNCFSVFFRVQRVFDNCCATLMVLEPRDEDGRRVKLFKDGKLDLDRICEVERFEATDSCITVDLKCFCGVQCIKDVFINCEDED